MESPKQPLSSTTNRDDSEQVVGRHENQRWHHGPSICKKRATKRREASAKRLTWEALHKESHKTARHNTNKKAKDMDLAPDDKPIKIT